MSDNITLPRDEVELALDALEYAERNHGGDDCYADSITALRAHLAAPRPEPEPATDAQLLAAYRQRGCGFYIEFKEIWQVAERFHGIVKEVQP